MNIIAEFFLKIKPRKKILFIVEDNEMYSKALQGFLMVRFPEIQIQAFSVGEACLMELHQDPTVVIMDHLLNTNLSNAATGLSIIKKIKEISSRTNIILLSGQKELDVFIKALSEYGCEYLRKDEQAFANVEQLVARFFA
jgi:ActR/RegA family two-component response regulator